MAARLRIPLDGRALEVCLLACVPCSTLRDAWEAATKSRAAKLRGIVLHRSRPEFHHRIALRTRLMLDGGAVEEVAASLKEGFHTAFLMLIQAGLPGGLTILLSTASAIPSHTAGAAPARAAPAHHAYETV